MDTAEAGPAPGRRVVALFDFDGTLTTRDTFLPFLRFACGAAAVARSAAQALPSLPGLIGAGRGEPLNTRLKTALLAELLRDRETLALEAAGRRFAAERLPRVLRPRAFWRLGWHRAQGHRVVVVSASLEVALGPFCAARGLELLATGLESRGGRLTGRLAPPNCYGEEKARRVRALLAETEPSRAAWHIYAYGDSGGDAALLALADEPHLRTFDGPPRSPAPPTGATPCATWI